MLAPVSGPPTRAQKPTVSPTAIAAKPSATRLSVATAMITSMSTKDSSHSMANADGSETSGRVAPTAPALPSAARERSEASTAPEHWAAMYGITSEAGKRLTDQNATVTAGLM